jgi:lipopolysaccharide/colanic/teichoic acid biosynthesis glycosyltransferase
MLFTTHSSECQRPAIEGRTACPCPPGGVSPSWYVGCKVAVEFLASLVLLVLTLPFLLLAALLVKLTSRGPAFYSQTRLGKDGRPYIIHKVRTMVHNCELHSGARWSTPHDPRITPLGRFLRASHVDELPQLWNVLCGDMSLVGPRPERPEFVPQLERALPHYRDRLKVRPGITGLAQIQLPPDTDLSSVRRKLRYDLYYLRHLSLLLDLKIMVCTGCKLFGIPFRLSGPLLGVPRAEAVEGTKDTPCGAPGLPRLELRTNDTPCDAPGAVRPEPFSPTVKPNSK